MEKCDERLQRFSAVSETLEIHRGDTQQSVMKLEEPDGARGYGIETSGNLRPKFSRLKRDPERCKKDIRNQGGTAMGCTVCLSASESGPQLRDRHC